MRQSETNDEQLRQEFQKNLPMVDAEQGWDRLQARLVNELSPGVARPLVRRRRAMLAAVAAGASVIVVALVAAAALGVFGGGTQMASVDVTTGPTGGGPATVTTTSTSPGTETTTLPSTPTTAAEVIVDTTSPRWGANSRAARDAAERFGDAVVSYLGGKTDLASVEALVAPSAKEDLTRMISTLVAPRGYKVTRTAGSDSSDVVQVWLLFEDSGSQQPAHSLTVVVDASATTITAIEPGSLPYP